MENLLSNSIIEEYLLNILSNSIIEGYLLNILSNSIIEDYHSWCYIFVAVKAKYIEYWYLKVPSNIKECSLDIFSIFISTPFISN